MSSSEDKSLRVFTRMDILSLSVCVYFMYKQENFSPSLSLSLFLSSVLPIERKAWHRWKVVP